MSGNPNGPGNSQTWHVLEGESAFPSLVLLQTEPYAAKMQTMRENWTDERLDDLNERVSDGFQRVEGQVRDLRGEMNTRFDKFAGEVNARFDKFAGEVDARFDKFGGEVDARFDKFAGEVDARFDKVDKRFERVDARFDRLDDQLGSIQRMIAFGAITLSGSFIAGFVVLAASL